MSAITNSFLLTYIVLITTSVITFIEALATKVPQVRHVMNLETAISLVAGYFYYIFTNMDQIKNEESYIEWSKITSLRYIDWSITTPMMLLALMLVLASNNNHKLDLSKYLIVLIGNYFMLGSGYLGEQGTINKNTGCLIGFLGFFIVFGTIYYYFVMGGRSMANYVLFGIYFIIWSIYGIVYNLEEKAKNIAYNTLDMIAKSIVGICLWAYFAKLFT